jgi:hypothetical protein
VQSRRAKIELHFLPADAPEGNPDEYLNHDLKPPLRNLPKPDSREASAGRVSSVMRSLQRRPARIRSYVHAAHVR